MFLSRGSNVKTAHIDWSFVVYIPAKSRDLADENNKILTEWKWFETTVLQQEGRFEPIKLDQRSHIFIEVPVPGQESEQSF
jgi:hypothetical protein